MWILIIILLPVHGNYVKTMQKFDFYSKTACLETKELLSKESDLFVGGCVYDPEKENY